MKKIINLRESMLLMREFISLLEKADLTGKLPASSLNDKELLREKNESFLEALDNENKGIWILNHELKNIFVNQKSAELFGYKPEEIIGQYLFNFMDENEHNDALDNFIKKSADTTEQVRFRGKNKKEVFLEILNHTLYDNAGKKLGILGIMNDIS